MPRLDAVSLVTQQGAERFSSMSQCFGILRLHHDVPYPGKVGRSDALQHLHEVTLDVDLEQVDRSQAPHGHLARDRRAQHLVRMKLALLAQLFDPGKL